MTDVVGGIFCIRSGKDRGCYSIATLPKVEEPPKPIARQPELVERLPDLSGDRLTKWREKLLSFPKGDR